MLSSDIGADHKLDGVIWPQWVMLSSITGIWHISQIYPLPKLEYVTTVQDLNPLWSWTCVIADFRFVVETNVCALDCRVSFCTLNKNCSTCSSLNWLSPLLGALKKSIFKINIPRGLTSSIKLNANKVKLNMGFTCLKSVLDEHRQWIRAVITNQIRQQLTDSSHEV